MRSCLVVKYPAPSVTERDNTQVNVPQAADKPLPGDGEVSAGENCTSAHRLRGNQVHLHGRGSVLTYSAHTSIITAFNPFFVYSKKNYK